MSKDTVGKISSELMQKEPESRDPIEIQRATEQEYIQHLNECLERGKKTYPDNFFIVVITKNERLMKNVFRNYFFCRLSCPTPDYDQTVYRYLAKEGVLEYLWTIPCRDASMHLKDNALNVSKEEKPILDMVLDFADGTLYRLAKKLNNEELVYDGRK